MWKKVFIRGLFITVFAVSGSAKAQQQPLNLPANAYCEPLIANVVVVSLEMAHRLYSDAGAGDLNTVGLQVSAAVKAAHDLACGRALQPAYRCGFDEYVKSTIKLAQDRGLPSADLSFVRTNKTAIMRAAKLNCEKHWLVFTGRG